MSGLEKKTVAQLKELCKQNDLVTGGKKQDLVDRLLKFLKSHKFSEKDLKAKTVAELKAFAEGRDISTSGRKQDIIDRLLKSCDDSDNTKAKGTKMKAPSLAQTSKGSKKAKMKKDDGDDVDDDDDDDDDDTEEEVVQLKAGSRCAVDKFFPQASSYHVYEDSSCVWNFTGNQTNIGQNNNKFYIIQLLESDDKRSYRTWTRWGRVGVPGQTKILPGSSLAECMAQFKSKFYDKTKNSWDNRDNFEKVSGKYDMVQIDYGADPEEEKKIEKTLKKLKPVKRNPSKLPFSVQDLIRLIFDVNKMTAAVVEMKYDVKKMPLGKLRPEQIKAGYTTLKKIESLIKGNAGRAALAEASSEFYTRIPHSFGMRVPPVIGSDSQLKEKLQLLEALEDIKTAMRLISQESNEADAEEDQHYGQLKCDMTPIEKDSNTFKIINDYLCNTHGHTHSSYKLEIEDAFEVNKDTGYIDGTNKMLLWHGSRISNWAGILSQGLRIAPPEAPVTGYMFGKGVYFADASSKSANYCFTNRRDNTGILLLCEVALGNQHERLSADCMLHETIPKGKDSTWGKGRFAPDPKDTVIIDGDVKVPKGKLIDSKVNNPHGYTLQYNEFIVYNTKQIRFRYLLRCKFKYH